MTKDYSLSSEIYMLENIQQAILDFSDVTEIIYAHGVLTVEGNDEVDIQEMFHEFMNYVLSL